MTRVSQLIIGAVAILSSARPATGQAVAQSVGIQVGAISILALHGTATLAVMPHAAGDTSVAATEAATWAVTTNEDNRRVMVSLDQPLPAGVTILMDVAAPSGATGHEVSLTDAPQIAVSNLSRSQAADLAITYRITTAAGAVVPAALIRSVHMTIQAGGPAKVIALSLGPIHTVRLREP